MYLAQAINIKVPTGSNFSNLSNITFSGLISAFIVLILIFTSLLLLFILLFGGISVMLGGARGDAKATAKGRMAITAALIGFMIIFGAWAIVTLINAFFGVNILQLTIPTANNP